MGVRDAADLGERLIKFNVRGRIGRGAQIAFDHLAVQVDDHHVLCLHLVVLDARGLDDDKPRLSVDLRDVAPGEQNELVFDEIKIGL